jgi:hypothetical protein
MTRKQLADAIGPAHITQAERRALTDLPLPALESLYFEHVWHTYLTTEQMLLTANRGFSLLSDYWEAIGMPRTDGIPPGTRNGRT